MPDEFIKEVKIAIIGAGPAGIEAALQAEKHGTSYTLLEKESVGSLFANTMSQKRFHQFYGRNTTKIKGGLDFPDNKKGYELVDLWKAHINQEMFMNETQMTSLAKEGDHFIIKTTRGKIKSEYVVLATGTFESPKKLHIKGELNNPNIKYRLDYTNEYNEKNIIVVGGGNSASETVINLAENNNVTMIVRKKELAPSVTEDNLNEISKLIKSGRINFIPESQIEEFAADKAKIKTGDEEKEIAYDLIFINIGFEKPVEFLQSLGVECKNPTELLSSPGIQPDELSDFTKPILSEHFETNINGLYLVGSITGTDSIVESANQAYDVVNYITTSDK